MAVVSHYSGDLHSLGVLDLCELREAILSNFWSFPGGTVVKNPPAYAEDTGNAGLILWSGRFPRVGRGNPIQ